MAYAWVPHPGPQWDFCSRGEFEVLFGGAAGPGKTDCLVMDAARDVAHPRFKGLLLRRTFPQLEEIIDRTLHWYPRINEHAQYRSGEHRWYFPSGATIRLGHMQYENDKYNYQGKEFQFIGFDEVTQFTLGQYLYLHSRARSTIPELPPKIRSTTNPGGVGHNWCKERFVDIGPSGQTYIDPVTSLSRAFVSARLTDNPSLTENDPDYINRLMGLPEIERMRLIDGVWDAFEGQAFPELTMLSHGCDPFKIPPEWNKFMIFDWGYSRPWAALWFAVDFDENLYMYRCHISMKNNDPDVGTRQTNTQIAKEIIELEHETIEYRVADPACWAPTKLKGSNTMHGPSFVEDSRDFGLFFLKADNDRIRGRQQVHERFRQTDIVDDVSGEVSKEGKFYAFTDQKSWWDEFMGLHEDVKNPEDIDTNQPDEAYDCTRYAFMSRPVEPKKIEQIPSGSFQAERSKHLRALKFSRSRGISYQDAYNRLHQRKY